jgi:CPA1 family monovalent cation:H+ antiporter
MVHLIAGSPFTVILLVIAWAFVAAVLSDKLRLSYTTILIVIGFALSFVSVPLGMHDLPLDRDIMLGLVVPPMIFEAAMRTRYEVFRTVHRTVFALAIFGVVVSALVSAAVLRIGLGLPLVAALTFGVIVSPTDPVSVVNLLKRVRAPERLTTILESEAYFNDATAMILYSVVLSFSASPVQSIGLFAYTFGGGVLVGLLVSAIAELLYRLVTEPLAETTFTMVVMFGSYALAETLEVSGLVAVAIAGLYMGNRTMRVAMSDKTRETLTTFWEIATFMATSVAFLLLGLKADLWLLFTYAPLIIAAFLAILVSRVVSVYPIVGLTNLAGEKIPSSWTKVLAMAGLRGAVSVALALSLPESPFKETVVAMTFGVAILSLIVQGELLQIRLRKMRLVESS